MAAVTVGNEAIFAGGEANSGASNVVDIYNSSTGQWSTATLSVPRGYLAATVVGTKAIFAGGRTNSGDPSNVVDIYDSSTGQWSTAALSQARFQLAATTVGDLAMFAGGWNGSGGSNVVDIYNSSTGQWSTATLSQARWELTATTVGTKAIFAGGYAPGGSNVVDIYDNSTGQWSTATLSQGREGLAAVTVGSFAVFAGGDTGSAFSNVVDIFNTATGQWSTTALSQARFVLTGAVAGGSAIFAGGEANSVATNVVDTISLSSYSVLDSNVNSIVDRNDSQDLTVLDLHANGDVYSVAGSVVTKIDSNAQSLLLGPDGTLYSQHIGSGLYTVAPGTPGQPDATLSGLTYPSQMAFDGSGDLFVVNGNNTVSEFASGGTSPIAALTGLNGPGWPVVDGSGDLFVENAAGNTVSEFAPGHTSATSTLTGLNSPDAMALAVNGDLYVANVGNNTVSVFVHGQTVPNPTPLTGLNKPEALAFDKSGHLYVLNQGNSTVSEFNPGSTSPSATLTGLSQPNDNIVIDGSGNLYVINGNNTVSVFSPGSTVPGLTLTGLNSPDAMALDANGDLYVANVGNNTVSVFAPNGVTPDDTFSGFNRPLGLAVDADGNLYVSNDQNPGTVNRFWLGIQQPVQAAQPADPNTQTFLEDNNGTLYKLDNQGGNLTLSVETAASSWTQVTPPTLPGESTNSIQQILRDRSGTSIDVIDTQADEWQYNGFNWTLLSPQPTLVISPVQSSPNAGSADAVTVTVENTIDGVTYPATGYTGTIELLDTDNAATGLPATYTFTSGNGSQFDNGTHTFNVTFETDGNQSITFDAAGGAFTPETASFTVSPGVLANLVVAISPNDAAGTPTSVTVTAEDEYGNVVTTDNDAVSFSATDPYPGVSLPNGVFLTSGTGTFNATLYTEGTQTVSATDIVTMTGDIVSGSNAINNLSGAALPFAGEAVTGPGIPSGTTILSVLSPISLLISNNATATSSGVSLTFTAATGSASTIVGASTPTQFFLTAEPSILPSGANNSFPSSTLVTVTVKDIYGNPVSGLSVGTVPFNIDPEGGGQLTQTTPADNGQNYSDNGDGTYTAIYTAGTTPGTARIDVTYHGEDVFSGQDPLRPSR